MSRVLNLDLKKKGKKNRKSLEIVRDMLSIASVKVRKTRIMYLANLSYLQMEKYLKDLLQSGLVERDDDSFYVVTGKGKEFVQMYEDYLERHRRVGEEIDGVRRDRLLLEDMCFNNERSSSQSLGKK